MMKNRINSYPYVYLAFYLALIFILDSCRSYKDIPYFKDFSDTAKPTDVKTFTFRSPLIQPDDLLSILIETLDPQINDLFNKQNVFAVTNSTTPAQTPASSATQPPTGYLVDKSGNVDLPVVGKIHLQGLTTSIARDSITERVARYYKNPTVTVRFSNFKVTVLGEVNKPGTYTLPNEKVSVLDALGMASDMTIFGKRENVLLIRDSVDQKKLVRLNLNSKNIISSPYFYLKQNDLIYVEPNKSKAASNDAYRTRDYTLFYAIASLLVVIVSRIN